MIHLYKLCTFSIFQVDKTMEHILRRAVATAFDIPCVTVTASHVKMFCTDAGLRDLSAPFLLTGPKRQRPSDLHALQLVLLRFDRLKEVYQ